MKYEIELEDDVDNQIISEWVQDAKRTRPNITVGQMISEFVRNAMRGRREELISKLTAEAAQRMNDPQFRGKFLAFMKANKS